MQDSITNKENQNISFKANEVKFSAFQPIEIKPTLGRDWITNGPNNENFKTIRDAYDDSPTNQSIINAFVNYIFGEGLVNKSTISDFDLKTIISNTDVNLICQDFYTYGGYSVQIIWDSNEANKVPLKIEYIPVYKLGVNYDQDTMEIDGFWYSWDWASRFRFQPQFYPKFTGRYVGNDLEILVVKRPHAEPFFPVPAYLSGVPWARVEGELANAGFSHFKNSMSDITLINYNNGRQATPALARQEAQKVRDKVVGTDNQSVVLVAFNESAESAVVIDKISPPELNTQNVFYAEEAERKLIVAHSAPPILFSSSNTGGGFSSNADEIEVATNSLYRRHINPIRENILDGLNSIFDLIDTTVKLDFKDFRSENLEEDKPEDEMKKEEPSSNKDNFIKKLFKK